MTFEAAMAAEKELWKQVRSHSDWCHCKDCEAWVAAKGILEGADRLKNLVHSADVRAGRV